MNSKILNKKSIDMNLYLFSQCNSKLQSKICCYTQDRFKDKFEYVVSDVANIEIMFKNSCAVV